MNKESEIRKSLGTKRLACPWSASDRWRGWRFPDADQG